MPILFGTKREQAEYFQKKGLDVNEIAGKVQVPDEKKEDPNSKKMVLDVSKLDPITEEESRILSRTRHFNDEMTVYMQADASFYDRFYSDTSSDPLTIEAHRIRRIYRNYRDYTIANMIRDKYLERILMEEFDGDMDMFSISMQGEKCPYWIPPRPIYTKANQRGTAPENFDLYDMESLCSSEIDVERAEAVVRYSMRDLDFDFSGDPGDCTYSDVCDDIDVVKYLEDHAEDIGIVEKKNAQRAGTIRNINDEFNAVIRSWYIAEDKEKAKKEDESRIFKYSKENLQKLYYDQLVESDIPENVDEVINDPDWFEKDHTDYNAMVQDPDSGRVMTYKEFLDRDMVKMLGKAGWGELRVMNLLSVGSTYDRMQKSKRELKSSIRKNKLKPETLELQRQLRDGLMNQGYGSAYDTYDETDGIVGSLSRTLRGRSF